MISAIIYALFKNLNSIGRKKKRQRIYDFLNAETKPKFLCLPYTQYRKIYIYIFFYRKSAF